MLLSIHPKLPMRDKTITRNYYCSLLGFADLGIHDYPDYLLLGRDNIELHFFMAPDLDPTQNDGQVYVRTDTIETLYQEFITKGVVIHPQGNLAKKSWGQKEFALLDPDNNLLTFGESL